MKREQLLAVWLAGGLFLPAAAHALTSTDNPYNSIVVRNPFGLIAPPPPAPIETTTPPSNIKLTGITTILGIKNALLMAQEPGPAGKSQSYILTEGQREGQIEVLAIDNIAGLVKVNNAGVVSTLNFDKDGFKSPTSPVATPGAMPGVPGIPSPASMPGRPMPAGSFNSIQPSGGNNVPNTAPAVPSSGLRQIPSRSLRLPQSSALLNQSAATPASTAPVQVQIDEQAAKILINQEIAKQRGDPSHVLYPPLPGELPALPNPPEE